MAYRKAQTEPTYWQKLQDPRWQKKRLEVFTRDDFSCTWCGDSSKTLHVHHAYYESNLDPWEYSTDTLHTVCEDCHEMANDLRRDFHFEGAKLWLELQCYLIQFMACMRENLNTGESLSLLREMIARCKEAGDAR